MKTYGRYTSATSKIIKNAKKLVCNAPEGGPILLCSGFWMLSMNPWEYDAVARPVVGRDPGSWEMRDGEYTPTENDLTGLWQEFEQDSGAAGQMTSLLIDNGKTVLSTAWAAETATAATYNKAYTDALADLSSIRLCGTHAALAAYDVTEELYAVVLPVRCEKDGASARAVRAWATDANSSPSESVQSQLDAIRAQLADREAELAAVREELEAARNRLAEREMADLAAAQCQQVPTGEEETQEATALRRELEAAKSELAQTGEALSSWKLVAACWESIAKQSGQQAPELSALKERLERGSAAPETSAAPAEWEDERAALAADLTAAREELESREVDVSALREKLAEQENALTAVQAELDAARAQLAEQREAATVPAPTAPAMPEKPTATQLAAELAEIPGVSATIAGANTAAPIVWATAENPDAAAALQDRGARWAEKRRAYYIHVA